MFEDHNYYVSVTQDANGPGIIGTTSYLISPGMIVQHYEPR